MRKGTLLLIMFLGYLWSVEGNDHDQDKQPREIKKKIPLCQRPTGDIGDTVKKGCVNKICTRKKNKASWRKYYAGERCCSYMQEWYMIGQIVSRALATDNCTRITLSCQDVVGQPDIVYKAENQCIKPSCLTPVYTTPTTPGEDQTKKALFVATGATARGLLSSVEILTEDASGMYRSRQVDIGGCSGFAPFPIQTEGATGALFNDLPHICPGYTSEHSNRECFKFNIDGSWEDGFSRQKGIPYWISSVVFDDWEGVKTAWWIAAGEQDGFQQEVWGGNPPHNISNEIKLPNKIKHASTRHKPCIAKISEHEAFVTALPKDEATDSNLAWIFNIQSNTWDILPLTIEKRTGVSCGFLNTTSGRFVVLAGGYPSSTTEIFNLDTRTWSLGPDIGANLYGGSMVSDDHQLLLVGGFNSITSQVMSEIRRMNESMASWETVGQLTTARANTVALAVPIGDLPPLC